MTSQISSGEVLGMVPIMIELHQGGEPMLIAVHSIACAKKSIRHQGATVVYLGEEHVFDESYQQVKNRLREVGAVAPPKPSGKS